MKAGILALLCGLGGCQIKGNRISRANSIDSIVFLKYRPYPSMYFYKYTIYNDTIYLNRYYGSRYKGIESALIIGSEVIGIIRDSAIGTCSIRNVVNPDKFNYYDYYHNKPQLIKYGPVEDTTDYIVNFPIGILLFDSIYRIPVLKYYLDNVIEITNSNQLDSIRNIPPKDSLNNSQRYNIEHPILGMIEHYEKGREVDTIIYLKGSYIDIMHIEKRLGIR